jgi:hypothetical protein
MMMISWNKTSMEPCRNTVTTSSTAGHLSVGECHFQQQQLQQQIIAAAPLHAAPTIVLLFILGAPKS